jgi:1-acyl-sn-glycerol-3-phosphate acyltransferase
VFHSYRFLRAQLSLASPNAVGAHFVEGLGAGPLRSAVSRANALQKACKKLCQVHQINIQVSGHLPNTPTIFVSNHLGYIDPVVICGLTPCSPLAKEDVRHWPVIGALSEQLNTVFVKRGDTYSAANALRSLMGRLEAGVSVLNFPEGTTTRGETKTFRRGVFGISARMGIPIVPIALRFGSDRLCWVDDDNLIGHYSRTMLGKHHDVVVDVGPPMHALPGEPPERFSARAREWIETARRRHEPFAPRRIPMMLPTPHDPVRSSSPELHP